MVVSILAIVAAMATPSFLSLLKRAQQRSVIYQLEAAVLLARHTAVVDRTEVVLCPYANASSAGELSLPVNDRPICAVDYRFGVALWHRHMGAWRPIRVWQWPEIDVMNRRAHRHVREAVVYDTTGLASRNLSWSICAGEANLSLVLNRIGRPHVRRDWGRC